MVNMKNINKFLLPIYLLLISCSEDTNEGSTQIWEKEIIETEQNFSVMAEEEGIYKAFLTYAAENAVLMRNDTLVIGKKNITEYYIKQAPENQNVSLTWKPDFVEVAASGDLGYTYGHYTYSYTDSSGTSIKYTGVFHTVWKKQSDGTWRYVWD